VLQNEACIAPICSKCADSNPDAFHLAFKRGLKLYGDIGVRARLSMSETLKISIERNRADKEARK
jgi:hypothetical protein